LYDRKSGNSAMNLVVDTSVIMAVLTGEPTREKLIHRTRGVDLVAPASVHWEIGNALTAMLKRKRISLAQVGVVLTAYASIPIRFVDVDLEEAMEIAAAQSIYAYDAYVVACARQQRCRLVSLDRGLLNAATAAGIGVLEVSG
jgi:predicted nucleic acid-binding protein